MIKARETTHFGERQVALEDKQGLVNAVFHGVADRYDLMNDLMSGGVHRLWKDAMVARLAPPKQGGRSYRVLDMAGGTGDIAFRMAERGADVTVADINQDMLDVGVERALECGLTGLAWSCQNAEGLTYPSRQFDVYTIAFGIRNVTHIGKALAEAHRVLKFGGRFFCLEFSSVEWPGFDKAYDLYSEHLVPRMGQAIAGDAESYRYLVESIRRFPPPAAFARRIEAAGFTRVSHRPLSGGIVAIHSGWTT